MFWVKLKHDGSERKTWGNVVRTVLDEVEGKTTQDAQVRKSDFLLCSSFFPRFSSSLTNFRAVPLDERSSSRVIDLQQSLKTQAPLDFPKNLLFFLRAEGLVVRTSIAMT